MKNLVLLVALTFAFIQVYAQTESEEILPNYLTESEKRAIEDGDFVISNNRGISTPPPYDNLRNMAEWEEVQALTIAWAGFPSILKQIVSAAKEECEVVILTFSPADTEAYLTANNEGGDGFTDMSNVTLLEADYDSIWMRDYAANSVYGNEVDDLIMVDWIYNRPTRPNDDASPSYIADHLGIDLYCLDQEPTDLVNTGGNYMSDGFGNGFSSDLILEENEPGNIYGVSAKTQTEIEEILDEWIGIENYNLMPTLPFDLIHHIDMHMKLLDEETILVGDFGNESDGPQIQANIEFIINNTTTKWGTPWNIRWIPMIPATNGNFPNGQQNSPYYRTFTNSVFINNTILFPSYREEFDSIARRIYAEELPGYNVIGIDCDDQSGNIISLSGALHCITHTVGVTDPLLISHNPLEDTENTLDDYLVEAYINHRSGISSASMFWRVEGEIEYEEIAMTSAGGNDWQAYIPSHPAGTDIEYYIHGEANSGKMQNRPMPAPEGYWPFKVLGTGVGVSENGPLAFADIYPNPASAITVIPVTFSVANKGFVNILDAQGKLVMEVYSGDFVPGEKKFFFDASALEAGLYSVVVNHKNGSLTQKLVII
jgi:agmatine deiminase